MGSQVESLLQKSAASVVCMRDRGQESFPLMQMMMH